MNVVAEAFWQQANYFWIVDFYGSEPQRIAFIDRELHCCSECELSVQDAVTRKMDNDELAELIGTMPDEATINIWNLDNDMMTTMRKAVK